MNLPSTRDSGQAHADLAGPSGAAMAPDGTVCAGDRRCHHAERPGRAVCSLPASVVAQSRKQLGVLERVD
jgi:hypothetical protein